MIEELDAFFLDFSVDVAWGDTTFKAIFDTPDQLVGSFSLSTDYKLTAKSSDIEGLLDGEILTIDEVAYSVRTIQKLSDGKMSDIFLSKV